jgi:hypothetical protein
LRSLRSFPILHYYAIIDLLVILCTHRTATKVAMATYLNSLRYTSRYIYLSVKDGSGHTAFTELVLADIGRIRASEPAGRLV